MSGPDFERMSRDEVLAWFDHADDISPVIATMEAASPVGADEAKHALDVLRKIVDGRVEAA